jgi:catechol 2,3-dioxygenase-like lactoylglutathione lyase family enzyme
VPPNVTEAVPFFNVTEMQASLRFYVDGLGFRLVNQWTPEGSIRWCWLTLGTASLMLQEYRSGRVPTSKLGEGVSVCFQCEDSLALYQEFLAHGLSPRRPFVGNGLWVVPISDPDGYELSFHSPTDAPEESLYEPGATPEVA